MVFVGTCQTLCPAQEIRERIKHRQVHPVFEKDILIKRYSRPAAGKHSDTPENVRPPEVLFEAMRHLMNIARTQTNFSACYSFVWDRLWAVRQDLTLQQAHCKGTRAILAQCVRFYVVAATLCPAEGAPLKVFDPAINTEHFLDTIGRLLHLYEDHGIVDEDRPEIESLYLLWNVDSFTVLVRASGLHPVIKRRMGNESFDVAKTFLHGNMYRLLQIARHFHNPLQWSALAPKLSKIRVMFLRALNTAYSSKACIFPLSVLARWLDMSEDGCEALLAYCKIPVTIYDTTGAGGNGQVPTRNVSFFKSRMNLNFSLEGSLPPYFVVIDRVEELRTQVDSFILSGAVPAKNGS
ncbi:germinal-center associated nuclear protein-like [Varroa destructor]|uniref:SAC3/GANP/THP3 conserved domain-containing protein n=1 Tax=Varroa destructor TaxID=109461 RepID=A0A7M7JZ40_VARDE|nr:germinal-center associated nuclear protein-like [Varroa destructor]